MFNIFNNNRHIYILTDFFNKGISFLMIPLFTHMLNPEDFTNYEQLLMFYSFFQLFGWMNQNTYFLKEYGGGSSYKQLLLNSLIFALLTTTIPMVVACYILNLNLYQSAYLIFSSFFSLIYAIYINKLQLDDNVGKYAVIQISCTVINVLLSLVFVRSGLGGAGRFIGLTLGTNLISILLILGLFGNEFVFPSDYKSRFLFGLRLMPHNIINGWLKDNIPRIMIVTLFLDKSMLGYYGVVFSFSASYNFFLSSIVNTFNKKIFEKSGLDRGLSWVPSYFKLVVFLYFIIAPLMYFLFQITADEKYHRYGFLIFYFILAFSFSTINSIYNNFFISLNKVYLVSFLSTIAMVIFVISVMIGLAYDVGIVSISGGYVFSSLIQLVMLSFMYRKIKFEISNSSK